MKDEPVNRYVLALYIADTVAIVLSLSIAEWLRRNAQYGRPFDAAFGGVNLGIYLLAIAIWLVTLKRLSAYETDRILRVPDEVQTVMTAVSLSTLLLAGALYLTYRGVSRLLFGYFFALDLMLTVLLRMGARVVFKRMGVQRATSQRILLVGAGQVGEQMAGLLAERGWMGLQVMGFLDDDAQKQGTLVGGFPVLGTLDDMAEQVKSSGIHEVIMTLPLYAHKRLETLVAEANELPVNVRVVPDFFPMAYLRTTVGLLADMPLVTLKEPAIDRFSLACKRVIDLAVSATALLLLWPAMVVIAMMVRRGSPGPVIFRQQRVGLGGKPFNMFKFRTMHVDADKQIGTIMERTYDGKTFMRKNKVDPRITRIGHHLRRWSLDELPQLLNVLRGDMSIVGPRPELPLLVQTYEAWQRKRFSVPPGLTGWWQVSDRADAPMALNTEADLYYIRHYSLLLDLQIILRTVGAVIRGKGAY